MPVMEGLSDIEISPKEYELVKNLIYDRAGINLGSNRQHLVQARLAKRVRMGEFSGFREYFDYLESDRSDDEIVHLIDAIATNTTFFFRETDHFDFLADSIGQRIQSENWDKNGYTIRVWSAACSSGEEAYSLAMVIDHLLNQYPSINYKILATDISQKVLAQACQGRYELSKINSIPEHYRKRYLVPFGKIKGAYSSMEIAPTLKKNITFAHFNLISPAYPFRYGFDYVFCRNVMIYFDRSTQQALVNRIADHIKPNGYLVVGHSESLNALKHHLDYVKPTIYKQTRKM